MTQTGTTTHNSRSRNVYWEPPSNNTIKVNTDVNLSKEDTWGLSAICRNNFGDVLATAIWCLPGTHNSAAVEAFAIYLAMELADKKGFHELELESDNEQIIRILSGKDEKPNTYVGNIISGIKIRRNSFIHVSYKHVGRKYNSTTHRLAQQALLEPNKKKSLHYVSSTPPK